MIGYVIIIIIIGIIVSIITEKMVIRRLRLEEGIIISKGKCVLKPGYGIILPDTTTITKPNAEIVPSQLNFNSAYDNQLMNFYKPLK